MRAFLGLGSNLGDRAVTLERAVTSIPDLVAVSPVYETDPVGGPEQGAYLNAVVELATERSPRELLELAQALEADAHRVRVERWGPRTLDVDVLLVGDLGVDEPDLEVPHPRMWERRFVLAPLRDLAPDLVSPEQVAAAEGDVRRTDVELEPRLYHVVAGDEPVGALSGDPFVHCCFVDQLDGVIERFFAGQEDLRVVVIDPWRFDAEVRLEEADGDRFPHVYGTIPPEAIVQVRRR